MVFTTQASGDTGPEPDGTWTCNLTCGLTGALVECL